MNGRTLHIAALDDEPGAFVVNDPGNIAVPRRDDRNAGRDRMTQDNRRSAFRIAIARRPTHLKDRRGGTQVARELIGRRESHEGDGVSEA
jgi:hypothetical protein